MLKTFSIIEPFFTIFQVFNLVTVKILLRLLPVVAAGLRRVNKQDIPS